MPRNPYAVLSAMALWAIGCSNPDQEPAAPASAEDAFAEAVSSVDARPEQPSQSALLPELGVAAQQALDGAQHLIAVVPSAWSDPDARLALYRREAGSWLLAMGPWDAQVGSKGLSWGRGLTSPPANASRVKVEGDKTAPAGLFRLAGVMGYAAQPPDSLKLPYQQASANIICVDDPASSHYNRIVDTSTVTKDWSSYEDMRRSDNLYSLLALIDHNGLGGDPAPVKGGGSCIFMHLWSGPGSPTIGCTALDGTQLSQLLVTLVALDQTVLAQLPAAEYADAVSYWHLPAMP